MIHQGFRLEAKQVKKLEKLAKSRKSNKSEALRTILNHYEYLKHSLDMLKAVKNTDGTPS